MKIQMKVYFLNFRRINCKSKETTVLETKLFQINLNIFWLNRYFN